MKKIILIFFLPLNLCTLGQGKSKKGEAFYMMDKNLKETKEKTARYLIHVQKMTDTCWQFDTYNIYGPMMRSERFKDEKGTIPHGETVYFNKKGQIDSSAQFLNGVPDGSFYYYNNGKASIQKDYSQGVLQETTDLIKRDSADQAEREEKKDNTQKIETESDFPGGATAWIRYLIRHILYPDRARTIRSQGTVVVKFIIDEEGHISDRQIVQSVEYSLDEEALRLIGESSVWVPAIKNGKKVKSYKNQPISFRLQ